MQWLRVCKTLKFLIHIFKLPSKKIIIYIPQEVYENSYFLYTVTNIILEIIFKKLSNSKCEKWCTIALFLGYSSE